MLKTLLILVAVLASLYFGFLLTDLPRDRPVVYTSAPVPLHAGLDTLGRWWRCDRGYQQQGTECVAIKLPEHSLLNAAGNDWECEEGFKRSDLGCSELSPAEKFAQTSQRRRQLQSEVELARRAEQDHPNIERPPCLAAYNKCTSSCAAEVYDSATGRPLTDSSFISACNAACAQGRLRCEEDVSKSQCNSFADLCRSSCSFVRMGAQVSRSPREVNVRSVCEEACASGQGRCVYQVQRSEPGTN